MSALEFLLCGGILSENSYYSFHHGWEITTVQRSVLSGVVTSPLSCAVIWRYRFEALPSHEASPNIFYRIEYTRYLCQRLFGDKRDVALGDQWDELKLQYKSLHDAVGNIGICPKFMEVLERLILTSFSKVLITLCCSVSQLIFAENCSLFTDYELVTSRSVFARTTTFFLFGAYTGTKLFTEK